MAIVGAGAVWKIARTIEEDGMTKERRWLITGISSGIGAALAEAALARGDHVTGTSRQEEALARFEASAPGRATGLRADLGDGLSIRRLTQDALAHGPVDILVNNAGQSLFGAFEEISVEETQRLFDLNVFGPWRLTQALLPHFRQRGQGLIINISSGCGLTGTPGLSAYCASKFALEGFTESMAQEVAGFGIRTMLVEPGAVATRFISDGTQETKARLPAYDFLSGQGKSVLQGYYDGAAIPPSAVADAVVAAIGQDTPPARLLVGEDMREAARRKAMDLNRSAGA